MQQRAPAVPLAPPPKFHKQDLPGPGMPTRPATKEELLNVFNPAKAHCGIDADDDGFVRCVLLSRYASTRRAFFHADRLYLAGSPNAQDVDAMNASRDPKAPPLPVYVTNSTETLTNIVYAGQFRVVYTAHAEECQSALAAGHLSSALAHALLNLDVNHRQGQVMHVLIRVPVAPHAPLPTPIIPHHTPLTPPAYVPLMPPAATTPALIPGALPVRGPVLSGGRAFRSMLETRHAALMTLMGVRFMYEHASIKVPRSIGGIIAETDDAASSSSSSVRNHYYYTPDFWLPSQGIHLEIKPAFPYPNEVARCEALSRAGMRIVLMYGEVCPGFAAPMPERMRQQGSYSHARGARGITWDQSGVRVPGEVAWVKAWTGEYVLSMVESSADMCAAANHELDQLYERVARMSPTELAFHAAGDDAAAGAGIA